MFDAPMSGDTAYYDRLSQVFTDEDLVVGVTHCLNTNYSCDNCRICALCNRIGSLGLLWVLAGRLANVEGINPADADTNVLRSITGILYEPFVAKKN